MAETTLSGGYNDLPPNFAIISSDDFWCKFTNSQTKESTRWILNVPTDHPMYQKHVTLFTFFDGSSVGYVHDIVAAKYATPVLYFSAAACIHEFVERKTGRCLHEYKCQKCGFAYTVDSSD